MNKNISTTTTDTNIDTDTKAITNTGSEYYFEIAVPTPLHSCFTYSYHTPIPLGSRVSVTFGKQKLIGVVLKQLDSKPSVSYSISPISALVDDMPILSPSLINIALWMSSYYFSPIGEVIKTMLPMGLNTKKDSSYVLSSEYKESYRETNIYNDYLLSLFFKKIKPSKKSNNSISEYKFLENKAISKTTLLKKIPPSIFKELVRKKILLPRQKLTEAKSKHSFSNNDPSFQSSSNLFLKDSAFNLTEEQKQAIDTVLSCKNFETFLLLGVTGSGKTEVFLQLIKHILSDTELTPQKPPEPPPQILVLVPEISLTPQMTSIFESRFGSRVSVLHSGMSDSKRWNSLEDIRTGRTQILIGARSSIFANFQNLSLIIVDEEHDSSYKQTSGVTYNARDIAVFRAKQEGIRVLLASATPSLESYFNACTGKYKLITMLNRIPGASLPEIKLIPKKISFSSGSLFTHGHTISQSDSKEDYVDPSIIEALKENLNSHKQAIILVNRRGYAFYLISNSSKSSVTCPNCSISLTLHKNSESLRCHYCDFSIKLKDFIDSYENDKFTLVGYGSEKIEQQLKKLLPGCRIDRMDSDTTRKRGNLEEILSKFKEEKTDILVGTQILAKGHDFPKVSVVVLLEVDQMMDMPDFRAGEKTFQLLVQASGRAGRSDSTGIVYLQTYRTNHPIIQKALCHDYLRFAKDELKFRKTFGYPPYSRMILVEILSENYSELINFCSKLSSLLEAIFEANPSLKEQAKIIGPITPTLEKINTLYRKTIILSSKDLIIRQVVQKLYDFYSKHPGLKNKIKFRVDVDPQSLF